MSIKTLFLILFAQIKANKSRFILAACSVMVGIWAILVTTSLSVSFTKSYIDSINTDPLGRFTDVYMVSGDAVQYLSLDDVKKFFAPMQDKIKDITPSKSLYNYTFYINDPNKEYPIYPNEVSFPEFYDQNSDQWIGKKESFEKNEIAICYYCFDFGSRLGFASPEQMLNKKVTLAFDDTAFGYLTILTQKEDGSTGSVAFTKKDITKEFNIAAVINDASFTGTEGRYQAYIPYSNYNDVIRELAIDKDYISLIYTYFNLILKDYRDEKAISDFIKEYGVYTLKPLSEDNKSITQNIFKFIGLLFSGFGIISLITAVFGIFGSITTSVLERKKEIGIYKSLGSNDVDIFKIFFVESIFLGILGWIFGLITALGTGHLAVYLLKNNASDYTGPTLSGATLEFLSFSIPLWLLGISFLLSIIVTVISGIIPAIKASKQNPADILRTD